jgi:putative PIN family toxin of toxin-antitoxin system
MKVVLDTNIWVSAVIWGGIPEKIVLLQDKQLISLAMSELLLNEIKNTFNKGKLQPKLKALNLMVDSVINLIRESVTVYPINNLNVPELRDPDDSIILATAIASESKVIVTGDQDLLTLIQYQEIEIMTAKNFLITYFSHVNLI